MHIYDTSKRKKVPFVPIDEKRVTIYVCGPTVYDDAHLGHARSAIAFDLLRRVLVALKYEVTFAKNFTDIDDKIIAKMTTTGKSLEEITDFYIKNYKNDMSSLNVIEPSIEPKATENLKNMTDFIEKLLNKEFAYKTDDGIYFDTNKDKKYLSLSNQIIQNAQARVESDEKKKDQKDFALWKFSTNEPSFDSPFGKGRPGWHLECSAMIDTHLAKKGEFQIDIHAGGADLLFPHHENEAAQTRCGMGQNIAKYWMHNGFVTIDGEKMSKSLGNSFYIKDALRVYHGEILRFYLLSTHYRADFNFNEVDLLASKKRLDKFYRLKKRVTSHNESLIDESFKNEILEALKDDLNISKALAVLDKKVTSLNESLDKNSKDTLLKSHAKWIIDYSKELLGIGTINEELYFQLGVSDEEKKEIKSLILARDEAKKERNFSKADKIRDELQEKNIVLMDTKEGTKWEKLY
ncbi:MAG: cysteine--tRNA ligase [Sulfurospirillaceae bacterium]|jgi:cysteinyl-tRNA synthetase|nr:cysteine--tRNA ligase [Sulfurospirillaceae bacterium]MCK9546578.1 cysteine--tRNA ligase [Sulfurospirillaceae bacterium]MDY0238279.1 cysteine--tRNA ligase [Campylobacterales bacterium]NLM98524.1 cysteine--tRNA ligase [Campylobacteraceae bacterium]